MKFLKDPVWQFIGVVIGIIAILVTWYLSVNERPTKKLRVEILSNSPLISVNTDIAKEIEIFYKDVPVQSLSLILLKFENTGNDPIRESDYSEPIQITLSSNAEIGETSIQETRPEGINLIANKIAPNQIELAKVLLNPGDQVVLRILAINNDETLEINTRIAGIQNIEIVSVLESGTTSELSSDAIAALICASGYGILLLSVLIWNSRKVVIWRSKQFGYDPALTAYVEAQEKMLKGAVTPARMRNAITQLRIAFNWDISYLEKAQQDPVFLKLRDYELYKKLIDEFTSQKNNDGKD